MKNSLSAAQYAIVAIILMSVFKLSVLPLLTAQSAGKDIWMSISMILLSEMISLAFIVPVSLSGGLDAIRQKYGKVVYSLISVPIIVVLIIKTLVYVSEVNAFSSSYLFYNISTDKVGIVFVIAAAYIATKGFKGIGRASSLALWTLPLILAVGLLFGETEADFTRLKPVCVNGVMPVFESLDSVLFWGFDLSPLLFCRLKRRESASRGGTCEACAVFGAVALACAVIALVYATYIAAYGGATAISPHAFAALGSFNVVNTEVGSIDWPAVVCWLSFAVFAVSFNLGAVGEWVTGYSVKAPFAVIAALAAICVFGPLFFYNFEKALDFAESAVKYFTAAAGTISPLAAFILVKLGKMPEADTGGEYEKVL